MSEKVDVGYLDVALKVIDLFKGSLGGVLSLGLLAGFALGIFVYVKLILPGRLKAHGAAYDVQLATLKAEINALNNKIENLEKKLAPYLDFEKRLVDDTLEAKKRVKQ